MNNQYDEWFDLNLVELGFCVKPHGIKGGFVFNLYNKEDSVLENGGPVLLIPKNEQSSLNSRGEVHQIEKISFGNKVTVYLKGVSDRNFVEAMIPFMIKIPRSLFPKTEDGEYYLSDLIGMEVYHNGADGEKAGQVSDCYDNGAQLVLVILKIDNEVLELPFINQFFPVVDIDNNRIEMIVPEMLEDDK